MTVSLTNQLQQASQQAITSRQDGVLNRDLSQSTDRDKVEQIAKDFESIFYGIVLKSMRNTVPKDGLISGGNAEDIYRSMLDTEYSKLLANSQNSDLGKSIEEYLLRSMDGAQRAPATTSKAQAVGAYASVSQATKK